MKFKYWNYDAASMNSSVQRWLQTPKRTSHEKFSGALFPYTSHKTSALLALQSRKDALFMCCASDKRETENQGQDHSNLENP